MMCLPKILCLAFALTTTPSMAEETALIPEQGDVLCIGYEAETHSCLNMITIRGVADDVFSYGAQTTMTDFGTPLTLVLTAKDHFVNGRFCMIEGSFDAAIDPPKHPMGYLTRAAQIGWAEQLAKKNACYLYRRCGTQYASITYLGEKRFPAVDILLSHHKADDPTTPAMSIRAAPSTEMQALMGNVAEECLPAT